MALDPIVIRIIAQSSDAERGLKTVASGVKSLGSEVDKTGDKFVKFNKAGQAIDDKGRFVKLKTDVKGVGDEAEKTAAKVDKVDAAIRKVSGDKFADAAKNAKEFEDRLGEIRERTEALNQKFEGIRNAGAGLALAGAGGIALSNTWAAAYKEGAGIEQRLESILESQKRIKDLGSINSVIADVSTRGHMKDDDPAREAVVQMVSDQVDTKYLPDLLEAAARNAEALNIPLDKTGELFAKAFAEGNLSRLKRANILFTDQEEDAVKAGFAISEAAGKAEFMRVVMESTARSTGELGSGLTEAEKATNDAARAYDDFATAVGRGSQTAEGQIQNLAVKTLSLVTANEDVAAAGGWVVAWGSHIAAGAGSLVAFAAQMAIAKNGFDAFRAAKELDTAVSAASTAANTTSAAVTTTSGAAATGASLGHKALALAEGEATVAAEAESVAVTQAGIAATISGRLAGLAATAFSGVGLAVAGIGVAAAATVSYVAYAVGQHIGWIDKEQGFLDRLSTGWERIKAAATGANLEWKQDEIDLKTGIDKIKADNSAAVLKGTKTQAQADKDNIEQEVSLREAFAKHQLEVGDTADMTKNQEAAARLRQQQQAMQQAVTPVTVPVVPVVQPPVAAAPTVTASTVVPGASPAITGAASADPTVSSTPVPAAPPVTQVTNVSPYATSIAALKGNLNNLKGRGFEAFGDKRRAVEESLRNLEAKQKQWEAGQKAKPPITPQEVYGLAMQVMQSLSMGGQIGGGLSMPGAPGGFGGQGAGGTRSGNGSTIVRAHGRAVQDGGGNVFVEFDRIELPKTGLDGVY